MRQVEQLLIVRVRVNRRHPAAAQAERLVQHLRDRREAVGGARRVRNDRVLRRVVRVVVDAEHQGEVGVLRRRRDDHLLRAAGEVLCGIVALREEAGRFDHDVDAQFAPGEGGRIALREDLEVRVADPQAVSFHLHVGFEVAEDGVVLEEVRQRFRVGDVVDRDELDVRVRLRHRGAHDVPPDPPEPVDTDPHTHRFSPPDAITASRRPPPARPDSYWGYPRRGAGAPAAGEQDVFNSTRPCGGCGARLPLTASGGASRARGAAPTGCAPRGVPHSGGCTCGRGRDRRRREARSAARTPCGSARRPAAGRRPG